MTKKAWTLQNKNFYNWYYSEYPFLKDFSLPLSEFMLKKFYFDDVTKRNLPVTKEIIDNYDFLFSYFLANYENKDDPNRFKGHSFSDNFSQGVNKTFSGISDFAGNITDFTGNINKFFPVILGIIILGLYVKIK